MTAEIDFAELTKEKCKFKVVSTRHLADLQREIENLIEQGQLDSEFVQQHLSQFKFTPPEELKNAESIIVVAMPRPPTKAIFNWNGEKQALILPPTYTAYDEKRLLVEHAVAKAVEKGGYKIATPNLPLKLLSVCSGLAAYGRNNIAYVGEMGSFMRLTAVYSNMPCEMDNWHEPEMMKACVNCNLCQNACPTGAISKNRFLLYAEKCLTYHNEKDGKIPFPKWIKPQWHNCIVGCIRCQAACPENKPYLGRFGETAEFDEQETKFLLKGIPREQIPALTMQKLQLLSLTDYLGEMPRNLSPLLK
ncbi:MAG: 4Fe-4S double cluster binding domain-containing protein [Candidatus Bathyarchaeia archaeon]|jgi:epoxyqueuosine reductase